MVSRGKVNILDKLIAYAAIFCLVLSFSFKPVFGADAPTEGSSGGESSSSSGSSSSASGSGGAGGGAEESRNADWDRKLLFRVRGSIQNCAAASKARWLKHTGDVGFAASF